MTQPQAAMKRDINASAIATAEPTVVTDGVEAVNVTHDYVQVAVLYTMAAGVGLTQLYLYGWANDDQGGGNWYFLEDLGTYTHPEGITGTFRVSKQVQVGGAFARYATRIIGTPAGTTPAVTTWIGTR